MSGACWHVYRPAGPPALDNETISSYLWGMRRKAGALVPFEIEILTLALDLLQRRTPEFHGFALASALRRQTDARRLTAHGTLYKALARLETAGFLTSRWEDPLIALEAGRPRRRLYRLTGVGEAALAAAPRPERARGAPARRRPASGGASP